VGAGAVRVQGGCLEGAEAVAVAARDGNQAVAGQQTGPGPADVAADALGGDASRTESGPAGEHTHPPQSARGSQKQRGGNPKTAQC
jgi:hypothetical protein